MKTAVLVLALALLTVVTAAEPATAAYAEVRDCPAGYVGLGVHAEPPGATAGVCCSLSSVDAACRRL